MLCKRWKVSESSNAQAYQAIVILQRSESTIQIQRGLFSTPDFLTPSATGIRLKTELVPTAAHPAHSTSHAELFHPSCAEPANHDDNHAADSTQTNSIYKPVRFFIYNPSKL
jgi:hypothetical protein